MDEVLVRIETQVPITIFELPQVKEKVNPLFTQMENAIRTRFDEIKKFITDNRNKAERYEAISYDEVVKLFKIYFYKNILNDAIKFTFSSNNKFDIVDNIIELLTEEKLKTAILGKPMICAFKYLIAKLPNDDVFDAISDGGTMLALEKEFLGEKVPY